MIFSIGMGAEYLSYVESIATFAPTFYGYIISILTSVGVLIGFPIDLFTNIIREGIKVLFRYSNSALPK